MPADRVQTLGRPAASNRATGEERIRTDPVERMLANATDAGTVTQQSTAELVSRAAGGDTAAFEALYRDNVGRIYALCMRMTANPVEAEELTQEAFIKAWQALDRFRGDAGFSTWLHRIAANTVMSHRRSMGRTRDRFVPQEDLSHHRDDTDRTHRGAAVDLEGAIAQLPEGAREIFVLYDIEGYRHDEIAEITGVAVGTSKAQLHRARRLLRETLSR